MNNTILLVEDEVKTGEMLKRALELEGMVVKWSENGKTALAEIEKNRFDLIILDLKLPEIPGEAVLEGLRKIDPYVPVLVYSNYEEPPVMKKLINLGVEGYIKKGADSDLWGIVDRVKSLLDPFSEEERNRLLQSAPEGMFKESTKDEC
jgi:DNA-binding response OmpR family regulator